MAGSGSVSYDSSGRMYNGGSGRIIGQMGGSRSEELYNWAQAPVREAMDLNYASMVNPALERPATPNYASMVMGHAPDEFLYDEDPAKRGVTKPLSNVFTKFDIDGVDQLTENGQPTTYQKSTKKPNPRYTEFQDNLLNRGKTSTTQTVASPPKSTDIADAINTHYKARMESASHEEAKAISVEWANALKGIGILGGNGQAPVATPTPTPGSPADAVTTMSQSGAAPVGMKVIDKDDMGREKLQDAKGGTWIRFPSGKLVKAG